MTPVEKVLTDIRAIAKDEHDKGSHPKEEAGAVGDRDHAVRHLIGLARPDTIHAVAAGDAGG